MTALNGELVVDAVDVHKTFTPSPLWLRLLAKSAVKEPVKALDGVTLQLEPRTICVVVGPNGAGKTTLFRALAGLLTVDAGTVRVAGLDPDGDGRRVRGLIGWMPTEKRSLFWRQTARENLAFHGRLHGMPERELDRRIDELLEAVGLPGKAESTPQGFSDGMRARLLLARALLHRPRLLILDEPTGPIDPVAAYELLELVRDLVDRLDVGCLISSHRLEEIAALQGRVHLLDRGRSVFDGDLREVAGQDRVTVVTLTSPTIADRFHQHLATRTTPPRGLAVDEATVRFVRPDDERLGPTLASAGLVDEVVGIDTEQRSLRDVLASFYGREPVA